MSLKKRVTAPIKVVSINDPALLELSDEQIASYLETRNIDALDLTKCKEPPTIFHLRPLQSKWEHLTDGNIDAVSLWLVFKNHVDRIENFDFGDFDPFDFNPNSGLRALKDETRDKIDNETIAEIAGVCIMAPSRFDCRPFPMPLTYWRDRARMKATHALNALKSGVK
jgi:hypothetical protein